MNEEDVFNKASTHFTQNCLALLSSHLRIYLFFYPHKFCGAVFEFGHMKLSLLPFEQVKNLTVYKATFLKEVD